MNDRLTEMEQTESAERIYAAGAPSDQTEEQQFDAASTTFILPEESAEDHLSRAQYFVDYGEPTPLISEDVASAISCYPDDEQQRQSSSSSIPINAFDDHPFSQLPPQFTVSSSLSHYSTESLPMDGGGRQQHSESNNFISVEDERDDEEILKIATEDGSSGGALYSYPTREEGELTLDDINNNSLSNIRRKNDNNKAETVDYIYSDAFPTITPIDDSSPSYGQTAIDDTISSSSYNAINQPPIQPSSSLPLQSTLSICSLDEILLSIEVHHPSPPGQSLYDLANVPLSFLQVESLLTDAGMTIPPHPFALHFAVLQRDLRLVYLLMRSPYRYSKGGAAHEIQC